jgi:predicted nucleic acid-binding Zn ribbon protein
VQAGLDFGHDKSDEVMLMSAFENSIEKIKQLANTAGRKTGSAVELSKCRLQAAQVNAMIQSTYERIGTLVYEQERKGVDTDLTVVCFGEIDALLVRLNELNVRITELRHGTTCPVCSASNPIHTVYCKCCGANLERERQKKDQKI